MFGVQRRLAQRRVSHHSDELPWGGRSGIKARKEHPGIKGICAGNAMGHNGKQQLSH